MTLFFLGNVFLDDIEKLTKALEDALNLDHFRASIFKTGVFPSAQHPKIFWLGVSRGTKKLMTLVEWMQVCLLSIQPVLWSDLNTWTAPERFWSRLGL